MTSLIAMVKAMLALSDAKLSLLHAPALQSVQLANSPFHSAEAEDVGLGPRFATMSVIVADNPVVRDLLEGVKEGGMMSHNCVMTLMGLWD